LREKGKAQGKNAPKSKVCEWRERDGDEEEEEEEESAGEIRSQEKSDVKIKAKNRGKQPD